MSLFSFFLHRTAAPQPAASDALQDGPSASPADVREEGKGGPAPPEGPWTISWERTIPSQAGAGKLLLEDILRDLAALEWGERDLFAVRLALEEALVNAMKHGNRFDPNKNVSVVCRIAPDLLHVEIQDEGRGFRLEDVPDPTDPDNLEKPSGRGIILMRSFMSLVEYNEAGNRVILEKRRSKG